MASEYLVQILLPLCDRNATPLARDLFDQVSRELSERFGGMTAYARAPARGLWEDGNGRTERDDIIVNEVMTEALDERWWAEYRVSLETRFGQDEVVIRALAIHRL
jgi:hypothetical protein